MHNITIETERLVLRPMTAADAEEVFEWMSDERVSRYMDYNTYETVDQTIEWLRSVENEDTDYVFGFVRKADGKLIGSGSIGPDSKKTGFWGFGYNLRYDCWGCGYATEAARAMIQFAHDDFGVRKFAASHAEPNKASGRVMEKCGLHFVGYGELRKQDGTCVMRSMQYEGELP